MVVVWFCNIVWYHYRLRGENLMFESLLAKFNAHKWQFQSTLTNWHVIAEQLLINIFASVGYSNVVKYTFYIRDMIWFQLFRLALRLIYASFIYTCESLYSKVFGFLYTSSQKISEVLTLWSIRNRLGFTKVHLQLIWRFFWLKWFHKYCVILVGAFTWHIRWFLNCC